MNLLVNIDVPDLDAAVRFYTTAIGLRVGRTFGAFGVELLGAGAPVYLLVKDEGTAAAGSTDQRRTYERHWTPVHLDFGVEDMGRAVEKAVAAGARLEEPVRTYKQGKRAFLGDPFGHGPCFVQFPGRGYDEIADP